MSWLTNIFHGKVPTEADVINYVNKVETDAENTYAWIATNGPSIVKDAQIILALLGEFGAGNPQIAVAVAAINAFTIALNALVLAKSGGEDLFQACVDAYKALKNAQVASAQAVVSVVK